MRNIQKVRLVQSHLTTFSMGWSFSQVSELDAFMVQVVKLGGSVLSYLKNSMIVVNTRSLKAGLLFNMQFMCNK